MYESCGIKMPAAEETVPEEVRSDDDQGEDEPEGVDGANTPANQGTPESLAWSWEPELIEPYLDTRVRPFSGGKRYAVQEWKGPRRHQKRRPYDGLPTDT